MARCIALDWKRTPEGMDYVPCDGTEAAECEVIGLLLKVRVELCGAHQKAFYATGADVVPLVPGLAAAIHPRGRWADAVAE